MFVGRNPFILMALSSLLFSVMSALAKHAQTAVPVIEVVFFRSLFSGLILLLLRTVRHQPGDSYWGHQRKLLLIRGLLGATSLILYFTALDGLAVADAMLLNQCAPIFTLFLARYFLREPVRRNQLFILPATIGGIAMILQPHFSQFGLYGLAGLGSAMVAAGVYICIRKMIVNEATEVIVLYFSLTASVVSFPFTMASYVSPSPLVWLELIGTAALSVAAQLPMTAAFRYDRAGRVAMGGALGPVFATAWDVLIWQRLPGGITIGGAILVLGSLVALDRLRRRESGMGIPPPALR